MRRSIFYQVDIWLLDDFDDHEEVNEALGVWLHAIAHDGSGVLLEDQPAQRLLDFGINMIWMDFLPYEYQILRVISDL